ncbi:hypothetical protein DsansV1_C08g0077591 [Dioscorea sansibarensis]
MMPFFQSVKAISTLRFLVYCGVEESSTSIGVIHGGNGIKHLINLRTIWRRSQRKEFGGGLGIQAIDGVRRPLIELHPWVFTSWDYRGIEKCRLEKQIHKERKELDNLQNRNGTEG